MTEDSETTVKIQRMKIMAEKMKLMLAIEKESLDDLKTEVEQTGYKVDRINWKLGR